MMIIRRSVRVMVSRLAHGSAGPGESQVDTPGPKRPATARSDPASLSKPRPRVMSPAGGQ